MVRSFRKRTSTVIEVYGLSLYTGKSGKDISFIVLAIKPSKRLNRYLKKLKIAAGIFNYAQFCLSYPFPCRLTVDDHLKQTIRNVTQKLTRRKNQRW
ncbi:MAG: hypothetical protein A2Y79_12155 [Deltaproteobacteria bacterium RBG_13_43_22]|nr:MAG: hypothetical protein A2Y79_12155 [Deltaproteobacteria bacterium RBG_13_43_22]